MHTKRELLEKHQVGIYFGSVVLAVLVGWFVPGTTVLEDAINPALAVMLTIVTRHFLNQQPKAKESLPIPRHARTGLL